MNDSPPPPSQPPSLGDPKPTSSVFHKLASAAIWCLISSFVVNIFLSGQARVALSHGVREFYFAVTLTTTLLMLAAVVCGVIALCGIPRYGKKRLLWKGLVGVLVPILLVAAAIPAFLAVRKKSIERARQQEQAPP